MFAYFNPYFGQDFFQFFAVLFFRIIGFIFGQDQSLVSDEIQILVLMGVGISSALVGSFLVLRKMTMLANSLSHTILLGIVISFLLVQGFSVHNEEYGINITTMLIASIVTGLITAFLTDFFNKVLKLQEDASIGIVFTTLFALGIILLTVFTRNTHVGTDVVMGNVDALHTSDLSLVWWIALTNFLLIFVFYKEYKITTFDPSLAKSLGFSVLFFNYLLMIQMSATSIGAFRAVGVLMVLTFIVGPPLIARLFTNKLKVMLFMSCSIGILVSILGVAISRAILTIEGLPLSTGGITVCLIILFYLISLFYKKVITTKYYSFEGRQS